MSVNIDFDPMNIQDDTPLPGDNTTTSTSITTISFNDFLRQYSKDIFPFDRSTLLLPKSAIKNIIKNHQQNKYKIEKTPDWYKQFVHYFKKQDDIDAIPYKSTSKIDLLKKPLLPEEVSTSKPATKKVTVEKTRTSKLFDYAKRAARDLHKTRVPRLKESQKQVVDVPVESLSKLRKMNNKLLDNLCIRNSKRQAVKFEARLNERCKQNEKFGICVWFSDRSECDKVVSQDSETGVSFFCANHRHKEVNRRSGSAFYKILEKEEQARVVLAAAAQTTSSEEELTVSSLSQSTSSEQSLPSSDEGEFGRVSDESD